MERSVAARSPIGSLDILWRPFEAAAGLARGSFRAIARHRRLRIALLAALVAIPLLAGGWLLLRKSSFTAVEHVRVGGVHGPQAQAIEAALDGAASHMSTLAVNPAALRAAVASYPGRARGPRGPELSARPADRGHRAAAGGGADDRGPAHRGRRRRGRARPRSDHRLAAGAQRGTGRPARGGPARAGSEPARRADDPGRRAEAADAVRRARVHMAPRERA